jgi:hypothetical protein
MEVFYCKKNHMYVKIFVTEKKYRQPHPVPLPLLIPDAILPAFQPPPLPNYRAGTAADFNAPIK